MTSKIKRPLKALWIESIKRVPYILVVLVLIVLYQGYQTGARVVENVELSRQAAESNKALLEQVASLSEDNKNLSIQSNTLAERSNRYQSCIANLFAKYTIDYQPVIIEDLENCVTKAMIIPPKEETPTTQSPGSEQPQPTPDNKKPKKGDLKKANPIVAWIKELFN